MATKKTKIIGAKEVQANLVKAGTRWRKATEAGLYLEGNNIMSISKRRVPVDLGPLKNSGYVTMPVQLGSKTLVEMGYGGEISKDYAVVQHQRRDFEHPDGGQAKYLESVIDERTAGIAGNILRIAKAAFKLSGSPGTGTHPIDPNQGEQLMAAVAIGRALRSLGPKPRATMAKGGR